ncbi:flavodoxin family protein, partial [candidate division CSSED10-310 bacterium]
DHFHLRGWAYWLPAHAGLNPRKGYSMSPGILGISATPRSHGNSDILLDHILTGAQRSGATIEKVRLSELTISPCKACNSCKKGRKAVCRIDDGMQSLTASMRQADFYVFATPVYFFSVSAQMKIFLDRLYVLINKKDMNLMENRKAVVALTYGDPDVLQSGAMNAVHTFQDICNFFNLEFLDCIHASCMLAGDINCDEKILEKALLLGERLGSHV